MTPATFRTICARCAAPLEYRDPDVALKAHEARCFVVGDYVRWEYNGEWYEGKLLSADGGVASVLVEGPGNAHVSVGAVGHGLSINIRRIPRPEQAVEPCTGTWTHAEPLLHHCSQDDGHSGNCYDYPPARSEPLDYESRVHIDAGPSRPARSVKVHPDPLDVEHDGTRLSELLSVDEAARRENRIAQIAKWTWTPAQRAAVSAHWSAELRAKVAASSERERLSVVAPDLDLELANCEDAE